MKKTSNTAETGTNPGKKASSSQIGRLLARSQGLYKAVLGARKALADAEDRLTKADYELRIAMGASKESADKVVIEVVKKIARCDDVRVFLWFRSLGPAAIVVAPVSNGRPGFFQAYREQIFDATGDDQWLAAVDLPPNHDAFDVLCATRTAMSIALRQGEGGQ